VSIRWPSSVIVPACAEQADQRLHQRRFSGAVRTQDRDGFSGLDGDREIVQRHDPAAPDFEVLDRQQRRAHRIAACPR
jgi:hypothetical protein